MVVARESRVGKWGDDRAKGYKCSVRQAELVLEIYLLYGIVMIVNNNVYSKILRG
jgi:hypothetical protein